MPTPTFSEIFNEILFRSTLILLMCEKKFEVRALPVPEIIPIGVLGESCEPPILREDEAIGGRDGMVTLDRVLVNSYRPSILHSNFS